MAQIRQISKEKKKSKLPNFNDKLQELAKKIVCVWGTLKIH
jgi:hypothetical protein